MARNKKNGAAGPTNEEIKEQAKQASGFALISAGTLRALLKQDDNYKQRIDGLTGELREAIGYAVEKKHLNKKMYAVLKKFYRYTSDEKLADDWRTLLALMDMAGVMRRIDSVAGLPLDGENMVDEEQVPVAAE